MGEKRHFGGKLSIFSHLTFRHAPSPSGLGAIGSPRAPLPDPSLKNRVPFQRGPQQNGLKEAVNFDQKTPFWGQIFNFFPFNFPTRPELRVWVQSVARGPLYQTQV